MDAKTRLSRIQLMCLMDKYPDYAQSMGLKTKSISLCGIREQHQDIKDGLKSKNSSS